MNVTIGVDGSDCSLAACQLVGKLLSATADQVTLYYSPPDIIVQRTAGEQTEEVARIRKVLADAVFESARRQLPAPLANSAQLVTGIKKPGVGLLLAAEGSHADLIAVGARGSSPLKQLQLGSVARSVVHAAHIPVLVARPTRSRATRGMHVLFASDGSSCCHAAAAFLNRLSWPQDSSGQVVTVFESLAAVSLPEWLQSHLVDQEVAAFGLGPFERDEDEKQRIKEGALQWCGKLPTIFDCQSPIIQEGHPAEEILDVLKSEQFDLVVLGARGLSAMGRLLLGSTSEQVLTHAPCSVLIVREHETP
jgi:nucleotide-binding universal stress UspA family protein